MKLQEVFDKPEKIKWKTKTKRSYLGSFVADDYPYNIVIKKIPMRKAKIQPNWYNIQFGIDIDTTNQKIQNKKDTITQKGFQGILNVGQQTSLKVFATVVAGIQQFVQEAKPDVISFQASEPSRKKLYARLSKTLGTKGNMETIKREPEGMFTLATKEWQKKIEDWFQ